MENVSEALKIVFSMLILVMALSISISLVSQVRETSDIIIYMMDRENDYENNYVEYDVDTIRGKALNNRIVGVETVIPTLYRSYRENFKVIFLNENGTPFYLYESKSTEIDRHIDDTLRRVNIIDLADESGETWSSLITNCDNFLNELISGVCNTYIKSSYGGLYKRLSGKKITEYMGEYSDTELKSATNDGVKKNEVIKRVIAYVISN